MTNSERKMKVEIVPTKWTNGKEWVQVTLLNSRIFFPSFEDIYRIVQSLCECEDRKYPEGHHEGREMVTRFLIACCKPDTSWESLAADFNIPIRDGERIVNSNSRVEQPPNFFRG